MRFIFILNILSASLYIVLGGYTYFRRPRLARYRLPPSHALFIWLCAFFALGTLANAFFLSSPTQEEARLWFLSFSFTWYLTPGMFVLFSLLMAGSRLRKRYWLLVVPGVLISIVQLFNPQAVLLEPVKVPLGWHAKYNHSSFWHWFNVANYSLSGLISILILTVKGLRSSDVITRKCSFILLWFFIPTFVGTYILGFVIRFWGIESLPPMLPMFLTFLVSGFALAQFRYDLLSFAEAGVARHVIATMYDAVVITDRDGMIVETNIRDIFPEASEGEEEQKHPLSLLIPGAEKSREWLEAHLFEQKGPFEGLFVFGKKRVAPATISVRSIESRDHVLAGYLISAHDISAEKDLALEIDRRLMVAKSLSSLETSISQALHASPVGMMIVDIKEKTILDANQAMAELFGVPQDQLIGSYVPYLKLPLDWKTMEALIAGLVQNQIVRLQDVDLLMADGRKKHCVISASPFVYKNRQGGFFILLDVTDLDRLQEELVKTQRLESIGILAGGIAHDFNNILTAILGNISLLKLSIPEDSPLYDKVLRAESACFRARDLSYQLLTFAKGGDPVIAPVDVVPLLRESIRLSAAGSPVTISLRLEKSSFVARADAGQLVQCFNNLILNAIQAMPNGGTLTIQVRQAIVDEKEAKKLSVIPALVPGTYVKIEFADTGFGISPEHLERIFEPFFSSKKGGSGLGLAIVYSVIKHHGGAVGVQSKVGEGSVFSLYLPEASEAPQETEKPGIKSGRGHVLVMDDEYGVRSVLGDMLQRLGYMPVLTSRGEEAVEVLRKSREEGWVFVAAILDLVVPTGMGGKETARILRTLDPNLPLFISSGYSEEDVLADYKNLGFDGIIPKPYNIEELSEILGRKRPE